MEKFTTVSGVGVPLERSNVDTDQIIPAVYLKRVARTGFEDALFSAWRSDPNFSLDSSDGVYIVFLCIGIIGYFTIPTVAGWIIQAGGMGGYNRNMNQMAGRAGGMAGGVAGATAGNAVGRIGKLLK